MMRMMRRIAATLFLIGAAGVSRADCILDIWPDSIPPFSQIKVLFPNWLMVPTSVFSIYEASDDANPACTSSSIRGITILNYGTATGGPGGDVTNLYFMIYCSKAQSAVTPMTYANVWSVGGASYPAWTWSGDISLNDSCDNCFCFTSLFLYTDISSCPTDGATVALGPGYNVATSPAAPGGIYDSCPCTGPSGSYRDEEKPIKYVLKSTNEKTVAPGDRINYTLYYGKPGTGNIDTIYLIDSLPLYTHFCDPRLDPTCSCVPLPDLGWEPAPGPPLKLRWTIPGPHATAGGATGMVTFSLTVDWGNGDGFEAGSGDVAAPEGEFLPNTAHMSWVGGGCAPVGGVSNTTSSVVRRFLFWKLGDNDLLFAPRVGVPDDEIIYTISVKNVSDKKTWWRVTIWDTVPKQLDVWGADCGMEDACAGWTMTPTGCAAASAGWVNTEPGVTLLTWQIDMPPRMTLEMKWKARVSPYATAGSTAINLASLMALGRTWVDGGTGHQRRPKNFVHLANIVLRTSFISYAGIGGDGLGKLGMFVVFFPLNRSANFELRGLEYSPADAWTVNGGLSDSIGPTIGNCLSGFPGGNAGCMSERAPADYSYWSGGVPGGFPFGECAPSPTCSPDNACSLIPLIPYHHVYKLVANAPVLWQLFSCGCSSDQDSHTFAPSTSLSFSGYMHYSFNRRGADRYNIINTSVGPHGILDPELTTSVHVFTWDHAVRKWQYEATYEIDKESQVMPGVPKCNSYYRFVSSQTRTVIRQAWFAYFGPAANNFAHMSPTRFSGNLSSAEPGEAFYLFPGMWDGYLDSQISLSNMAASGTATYRIERYVPRDTISLDANVPSWLWDSSGAWQFIKDDTVPAGFNNPANPHVYGTMYDSKYIFNDPPGSSGGLWRITLLEGGPIQMCTGSRVYSTYSGGSLLHAATGAQVGAEFWISEPWSWNMSTSHCNPPFSSLFSVDVFCPRTNMTVKGEDTEGYSAIYTTTGTDQCVTFLRLTDMPEGTRRNFRMTITGGDAIVMYNHCQPSHKFFTAPFLRTGVHYDVIVPATVYAGQNFWLTVVAVDSSGVTKEDYCATSTFTSTDPLAVLNPLQDWYTTYGDCPGTPIDNGVKIVINVMMKSSGYQTIVVNDAMDGSVTGLASLMVVAADVKLTKVPGLAISSSGDTVQFKICWSNYSATTAFNLTITDAVPMGTDMVSDVSSSFVCGVPADASVDVAYSLTPSASPPSDFQTTTGGIPLNVRWMRWTVRNAGVNTSGCVCYRLIVR